MDGGPKKKKRVKCVKTSENQTVNKGGNFVNRIGNKVMGLRFATLANPMFESGEPQMEILEEDNNIKEKVVN